MGYCNSLQDDQLTLLRGLEAMSDSMDKPIARTHVRDLSGCFNFSLISEEEHKIRDELQNEIERYLEEEIKDGISDLARRLHSLYQQNKCYKDSYTEVNVKVNSEGGCMIEINKYKNYDVKQGRVVSRSERLSTTLRSVLDSGSSSSINKNGKKKLELGWKY